MFSRRGVASVASVDLLYMSTVTMAKNFGLIFILFYVNFIFILIFIFIFFGGRVILHFSTRRHGGYVVSPLLFQVHARFFFL